ncbi:MAG: preprotein translocase subunit SecE [Gammaproteobacteria bacterium]
MNTQVEESTTFADKLITLVAIAILVAGVVAYYYFADQSVLVRAPMVLAGIAGGLFVFYQSGLGKRVWAFIKASRIEIRKVVWPTRREAFQTTIAVIIFTLIFGLFFWVLDMFLRWVVRTFV